MRPLKIRSRDCGPQIGQFTYLPAPQSSSDDLSSAVWSDQMMPTECQAPSAAENAASPVSHSRQERLSDGEGWAGVRRGHYSV